MKTKYFTGLVGFIFLVTVGLGTILAGDVKAGGPTLKVSPAVAALDRNTDIIIMGSGFTSGQEILIITNDTFGLTTGLDVRPVSNERGAFAVVWNLGRYARRKIIEAGVHNLRATDRDYNVLASAPLALVDVYKNPKEWPEYGKAVGLKKMKKKKKK